MLHIRSGEQAGTIMNQHLGREGYDLLKLVRARVYSSNFKDGYENRSFAIACS